MKYLYTFLFLISCSGVVNAGWFGPDNYEECMSDAAKKGLSAEALYWVEKECDKQFHREFSAKELTNLELRHHTYKKLRSGLYEYEAKSYNGNNKIELKFLFMKCRFEGKGDDYYSFKMGRGGTNIGLGETKSLYAQLPHIPKHCLMKSAEGRYWK